jgi:activator of HSP90 ATPase
VQKWRGKEWPEGHFSEATFEFKKIDGGKTELLFTQTNDQVGYIEQGWYYHYWCKMEKYFKRS